MSYIMDFFHIRTSSSQKRYLNCWLYFPPVHQKILQWNPYRRLWVDVRWELHHCLVLPDRVHLCYWWDGRCHAGEQAGHQIWKVSVRDGSLRYALCLFKMTVCPCRKGTLVRASVLVFIGGALMGFSRACRMPAMVIVGRFITGVHSGRLVSFLEELHCTPLNLKPHFLWWKTHNGI